MIVTKDLDSMIDELREAGASFRGEVAEAGAGRQILLQDPSGNVGRVVRIRTTFGLTCSNGLAW
jgi:hypothetical protein